MKNQALFFSKDKSKNNKMSSAAIFVWGFSWLVGCFGLNGPLRQFFSLYRAVSQREGERKEN